MTLKEYARHRIIPVFFISTTCITFMMAVTGSVFVPDAQFGYGLLFSPFVYGFAAAVIQLIGYSRRELPPRQALIRNILHAAALEAGIMSILYFGGALDGEGLGLTVTMAVSVLVIYFAVSFLVWANDKRSCGLMNTALKTLQEKKG